jgi:hypothetical protein
VDLLHVCRWGYIWVKALLISCDSKDEEAETITHGHGELRYPDWKMESIPVFLDFCLESVESGTVNVDCNIIWSGIGREDIHKSLGDELGSHVLGSRSSPSAS